MQLTSNVPTVLGLLWQNLPNDRQERWKAWHPVAGPNLGLCRVSRQTAGKMVQSPDLYAGNVSRMITEKVQRFQSWQISRVGTFATRSQVPSSPINTVVTSPSVNFLPSTCRCSGKSPQTVHEPRLNLANLSGWRPEKHLNVAHASLPQVPSPQDLFWQNSSDEQRWKMESLIPATNSHSAGNLTGSEETVGNRRQL